MRYPAPTVVARAAIAFVLCAPFSFGDTLAQTHKHYEEHEQARKASPTGQLAPRLQNLGPHTFPVSTDSEQAQRFMNQGLNLTYGFNHAEAGRSFREAARLDPECAMAYWGQALVLGPNINAPMDPADEPAALELARKAISLRAKASPREQAYIEALAERYSGRAEERVERDRRYAAAMRKAADRFPDDLDLATLFAEAMMDLRPWGYWTPDASPQEGTVETVDVIESVIARNPNHPGALHLYIHLMEATMPGRAEAAADRLLTLMPGAGHIVHMPSHIYQRVGRYRDAIRANQMAVEADEDYIVQCRAQGLYPMGYYPHNIHFLWWAATMSGERALALESAKKVAGTIPDEALTDAPMLAGFRVIPYYAHVRFGQWDEMLREPAPLAASPFMRGMWQYGRGRALVAQGNLRGADAVLAELRTILGDKRLEEPMFSPNTMLAILRIAPESLAGHIAAARKDYDRALLHLERAVRLEDGLVYTEPSEWVYPTRHDLADVLLRAGRADEAETVYWEDLKRNRDNGWALKGLSDALRAQGKGGDAALAEERFRAAWPAADEAREPSRVR